MGIIGIFLLWKNYMCFCPSSVDSNLQRETDLKANELVSGAQNTVNCATNQSLHVKRVR